MYAALTSAPVHPEQVDEAIRIYQDTVVPITKQIQGLQHLKVLLDRTTSTMTVFALYDTEANARAVETSDAYRSALGQLVTVLAGTPTRQICEVVIEV